MLDSSVGRDAPGGHVRVPANMVLSTRCVRRSSCTYFLPLWPGCTRRLRSGAYAHGPSIAALGGVIDAPNSESRIVQAGEGLIPQYE
jgi:hypothetical protein